MPSCLSERCVSGLWTEGIYTLGAQLGFVALAFLSL